MLKNRLWQAKNLQSHLFNRVQMNSIGSITDNLEL